MGYLAVQPPSFIDGNEVRPMQLLTQAGTGRFGYDERYVAGPQEIGEPHDEYVYAAPLSGVRPY
jgi:hypothetical protein